MIKVKTDPANVFVGCGHLSLSDAGTGGLVSSNSPDAATTGDEFRTGYTEARKARQPQAGPRRGPSCLCAAPQ